MCIRSDRNFNTTNENKEHRKRRLRNPKETKGKTEAQEAKS
jgi:hypothetical protein